jgi:hypothetical protein
MLPVESTNMWVAFRLEANEIKKQSVGLSITVFNENKLIHVNTIDNCIRLSTKAEDLDFTRSYSIQSVNGNRQILLKTTQGEFVYDVVSNNIERKLNANK